MVLLSGPLWARKSWGAFWTGEPRLVLTLALFVIFLAYVLVRLYGGRSPLARRIGAVLAIFGFADIPLVRFAVQKWQGNHPQVVMGSGQGLAPEMVPALVITSVAFALLFAALLWMAIRVGWLHERAEELHLEIGDRELLVER
jgi:heme exporter protein C